MVTEIEKIKREAIIKSEWIIREAVEQFNQIVNEASTKNDHELDRQKVDEWKKRWGPLAGVIIAVFIDHKLIRSGGSDA